MTKFLKKSCSVFLAFALVVSTLVFTSDIKADVVDEWKANAIKTPTAGKLVGAGYIDVEFDNSMEGYTYTVYLDGNPMYWNGNDIVRTDIGEETDENSKIKTFESTDTPKTEVYTTSVKKHTLTVKAVKGSDEIVSDPCEFYVSKKGLALGDDMTDKIAIKKLNCSWYYNWGTKAFDNDIDEGVDHVPMMWGNRVGGEPNNKDNKNDIEDIQNLSTSSNYIMGFNEPDIGSQANMSSIKGIRVWNEYIAPFNMRTISPAPADPNGASGWLKDFFDGLNVVKNKKGVEVKYITGDPGEPYFVEGVNCDSVALHYYKGNTDIDGLLGSIKKAWETFHKPIWVTEVSVMGRKDTTYDYSYDYPEAREKVEEFVGNIITELDKLPYVERYAWFPYDVDATSEIDGINGSGATALFEFGSGLYTGLGKFYSDNGNPEGYTGYSITEDETFVWENRIQKPTEAPTTQEVTTNKAEVTTNAQTTNAVTNTTKQVTTSKISNTTNPTVGVVKGLKAKKAKKKTIKLSWKKVTGVKTYQVQYALNKKFTKKLKSKNVKNIKITIKGLKKKKKYYFRVRAIVGKTKGAWSKVVKCVAK